MLGEVNGGGARAGAVHGRRSGRWQAVVRLLAAGCVSALLGGTAQAQQPAMVQVDPVITEPLVQTVGVLGRIVAKQEGPVAARVAGPVAEIAVEVGDRVEAGALVATLDTTRLALDRALAEADARTARAELTAAERELELIELERARLVQLEGSAAFSRARLDDKAKEATVAASRIEAAAARLARARVMLDYRDADLSDAQIRAPFPGVVVARHVSAGAHVQVGEPVVSLVDDVDIEVEADVPAERLAELDAGVGVSFALAGGGTYEAVLRAIVPMENPLTRTRAVRFAAADGGLTKARAIGQSVTVLLPVGAPRDVVTVHKDAVTVGLDGRQVFVVDSDDTAQLRFVTLGAELGNRFEVIDGLVPGDLVVVRGNERLRPGQAVAYGTPEATGAPEKATPAGERS
jgi:RND family efflux transporter MFP subunit